MLPSAVEVDVQPSCESACLSGRWSSALLILLHSFRIKELAWACSSAGRAPALQAGGRRFDPGHVHQIFPELLALKASLYDTPCDAPWESAALGQSLERLPACNLTSSPWLLGSLNNSQIPIDGAMEHFQRLLVCTAIVSRNRLLDAVKL